MIISFTPLVSAFITAMLLIYIDKRHVRPNLNGVSSDGYTIVATSDTNQLIIEDDDEDELTIYLEDKH